MSPHPAPTSSLNSSFPFSLGSASSSSSSSLSTLSKTRFHDFFTSKIHRAAVRRKIHNIHGHIFETSFVTEPIKCSQCKNYIMIPSGQACRLCKLASHTRCLGLIETDCVNSEDNKASQIKHPSTSHRFEPEYFWQLTYCNHCGTLIKGLFGCQGKKCMQSEGCGMSVHFDCERLVCLGCSKSRAIEDRDKQRKSQQITSTPATGGIERWSRVSPDDFEIARLLGTGTFSKVYLARLKRNGKECAVKVVDKTNLAIINDPQAAKNEMRMLRLGRDYPFLTAGHCCFQTRDRLFYVMEYVAGQSLLFHLEQQRSPFTEDRARFYSAEIVLALIFLHKRKIIYRDLKPENILLDLQGHCKLLDFGMSIQLGTADMKTRTFCGTPDYMSPEIIAKLEYSFSADWWSLGVLLYEMLTGNLPFMTSGDDEELYKMILEDEVKIPRFISDEAKSILDGLLTKEPHKRLGCQIVESGVGAILRHPFFTFRTADTNAIVENHWVALETKSLQPPYIPALHGFMDERKHDEIKTLTPIDAKQLEQISQSEFIGFSFYSESFQILSQLRSN